MSSVSSVEDWASRLAERLPPDDIRRLAQAARSGGSAVSHLRATAGSAIMRDACDQLVRRLSSDDPAYLSGLLVGAARAVSRARHHQSVSVVWTGPESGVTSSRLTAATIIELIDSARSSILLVSYATRTEPSLLAALSAAVDRGVEVTLLAERHEDNPHYTSAATPFPSVDALRLYWPASSRPPGASLHAKVIVVDEAIALVGSANLTSRAMESNLECGILLRGGPVPKAIYAHVMGLHGQEILRGVER